MHQPRSQLSLFIDFFITEDCAAALPFLTEKALWQSLLLAACVNSHSRREVPRCVLLLHVARLLGPWQDISLLSFLCPREPLAFNSFLSVLASSKCLMLIQELTYLRSHTGFKQAALASCLVFPSSRLLNQKSESIRVPCLELLGR